MPPVPAWSSTIPRQRSRLVVAELAEQPYDPRMDEPTVAQTVGTDPIESVGVVRRGDRVLLCIQRRSFGISASDARVLAAEMLRLADEIEGRGGAA